MSTHPSNPPHPPNPPINEDPQVIDEKVFIALLEQQILRQLHEHEELIQLHSARAPSPHDEPAFSLHRHHHQQLLSQQQAALDRYLSRDLIEYIPASVLVAEQAALARQVQELEQTRVYELTAAANERTCWVRVCATQAFARKVRRCVAAAVLACGVAIFVRDFGWRGLAIVVFAALAVRFGA